MDADGDGYQDARCNPDPRRNGGDCDDEDRRANPGRSEICGNSVDDDCNGGDAPCLSNCTDNDLDGFGRGAGCRGLDCDDRDPKVNPWQSEICGDGIDQDCDGRDLGCPPNCIDRDNDGFGACPDGNNGPVGATRTATTPTPRLIRVLGISPATGSTKIAMVSCSVSTRAAAISTRTATAMVRAVRPTIDDTNPASAIERRLRNGIDDDCRGGDRPCVNRGEGACQDGDGDGFGRAPVPAVSWIAMTAIAD